MRDTSSLHFTHIILPLLLSRHISSPHFSYRLAGCAGQQRGSRSRPPLVRAPHYPWQHDGGPSGADGCAGEPRAVLLHTCWMRGQCQCTHSSHAAACMQEGDNLGTVVGSGPPIACLKMGLNAPLHGSSAVSHPYSGRVSGVEWHCMAE